MAQIYRAWCAVESLLWPCGQRSGRFSPQGRAGSQILLKGAQACGKRTARRAGLNLNPADPCAWIDR